MIDYAVDVEIPANTAESSPYTQTIKLTKGKLVKVVIVFQAGCAFMVHCCLFIGNRQVMPIISGQSYALDNYILERDTAIVLEDEPFELTFKGWSPNTAYDHVITVICTVKTEHDTNDIEFLASLLG